MRKLREHQVVVVAHKMEAHNNNIINAPGIRILQEKCGTTTLTMLESLTNYCGGFT